jgi:HD superfamily phosphodiesterase
MGIALKLAKFHPETDLEILKLAVIFHDISYEKYETHVEESVKVAEKFLSNNNYPADRITKVLTTMLSHSGPHRRKLGEARAIEGKIIYDSDKFYIASTEEGFEKYYPSFYLDETRNMFKKTFPKLFNKKDLNTTTELQSN